jgi:hypothetical protein
VARDDQRLSSFDEAQVVRQPALEFAYRDLVHRYLLCGVRPAFDEVVRAAELPIRQAAAKMLRILVALDLPALWKHPGLHFEKLHGYTDPTTGDALYSIRVTQAAPAVAALRTGPTVVLLTLHVQHDETDRRR